MVTRPPRAAGRRARARFPRPARPRKTQWASDGGPDRSHCVPRGHGLRNLLKKRPVLAQGHNPRRQGKGGQVLRHSVGLQNTEPRLQAPLVQITSRCYSSPSQKKEKIGRRPERWEDPHLQHASGSRRQPRGSSTPYGRAPAGGLGSDPRSHRSPSRRSNRHREDDGSGPERTSPWPPGPPSPTIRASGSRELPATAGSPTSHRRQHSSNAESSLSTCP